MTPAARMRELLERLYPICRSITGDGVRETLAIVGERVPMTVHEVPSGTTAYGWTINDEWNVRDAYVARDGERVVDFREHNLHLVSYSAPVRTAMTLAELRPHLFTLPDRPDLVPYRTSYYRRDWGFCLSQRQLDALTQSDSGGDYEVVVDTTLAPGSMTYGEVVVPGETDDEVLVSAHVCHPSLANDNLTGIAVATELALALAERRPRLTHRFVFAPGTVGSVLWLSRNADVVPRIRHGLVLTGLGGPGPLVYKRTRHGHRSVDEVLASMVTGRGGEVRDYSPYGYDERQYGALGFDLAVGRLSRTPHGEYPEYHTSGDDLDLVDDDRLAEALEVVLAASGTLGTDAAYRNLSPHGEPQLGAHGLYPTVGGTAASEQVMAMLWTLGLSDGATGLLGVAGRSGVALPLLQDAAAKLEAAGLLAREW